jgi:hypothetical protein
LMEDVIVLSVPPAYDVSTPENSMQKHAAAAARCDILI